MVDDRARYRSKIARGIVSLLIEAGRDGRETVSFVDATAAADELMTALALVMHNSPECASSTAARRTCDLMARRLQARVSEFRRIADAGGLGFIETVGVRQ